MRLLSCRISNQLMSQMGHSRPTLRVSAAVRCPLFPESNLLTAWQQNNAKGQKQPLVARRLDGPSAMRSAHTRGP